jgi:Ca2+-binding RTX toxin-like protein
MALDIAALQRMYGANTSTHNTATTYSLTDAGSSELDVDGSDGSVSVGRAYYGIWDTGGTDAISYSGSANALINLMPATLTLSPNSKVTDLISQVQNSGVFEYLHSQTQTELTTAAAQAGGFFSSVLTEDGKRIAGGYSIAQGAEIENAEGGSSEDLLIGNDGNNKLTGNGGSDYLFGGDGVDTILGGDGDDFIYGGASESDLRDVVYGGAGNDYVEGGYGNDELRGDAGNDTLAGGFGADTMIGGEGDDQVTGSAWGDVLFGGDGNDFINGGFGYDRVNGGTGADQFFHIGNAGHGSDWIQDYDSSQGDVLFYGAAAVKDDFLIQRATTDGAGTANTQEVFITHKTTGVLLWALVDGDAQSALNVKAGAETFDLLA